MRPLALAATAVAVAAATGLAAHDARAAGECRGLPVCVPVQGPWVVVPTPGDRAAVATWVVRCPRGYVAAGTDALVSHARVEVAIRGELGSPVGPGTTTRQDVLFSARLAGPPRPAAMQPFVGCIPTSGGGGRALTAMRPGEPFVRRVTTVRARPGIVARASARCPAGTRLVEAAHAVGFRTTVEPGAALLDGIAASRTVRAGAVRATARIDADLPVGVPVELQVQALCAKGRP